VDAHAEVAEIGVAHRCCVAYVLGGDAIFAANETVHCKGAGQSRALGVSARTLQCPHGPIINWPILTSPPSQYQIVGQA
jgi:hypothetical protein